MTGERVGRLQVLGRAENSAKSHHARFHCLCDCGNRTVTEGVKLRTDAALSCGCLGRERSANIRRTHGMSNHRLFSIWSNIMHRCYSPNSAVFSNYGGRGIDVCGRWHDVRMFIEDNDHIALPGLSIDRIDNDLGYFPENCRWATPTQQSDNRRTTVFLTLNGVRRTAREWALITGIPLKTLWQRLRLGWDDESALTQPVSANNRRKSMVEFNGQWDTIANHARRQNLNPVMVAARIRSGNWSVELAMTTPHRYSK